MSMEVHKALGALITIIIHNTKIMKLIIITKCFEMSIAFSFEYLQADIDLFSFPLKRLQVLVERVRLSKFSRLFTKAKILLLKTSPFTGRFKF